MSLPEETQYICNSIDESVLYDDPFYHLYINNFFSNEFYNNLLNFLPSRDKYIQINKTGSVSKDYPEERYIFNITPESFEIFDAQQKLFFGQVVTSLMSVNFFDSIIKKI